MVQNIELNNRKKKNRFSFNIIVSGRAAIQGAFCDTSSVDAKPAGESTARGQYLSERGQLRPNLAKLKKLLLVNLSL